MTNSTPGSNERQPLLPKALVGSSLPRGPSDGDVEPGESAVKQAETKKTPAFQLLLICIFRTAQVCFIKGTVVDERRG